MSTFFLFYFQVPEYLSEHSNDLVLRANNELWTNVIGDAFMVVTYFALPIIISLFIRRRKDLKFDLSFWVLMVFLVAAGSLHLLSIINIWVPSYQQLGWVKLITGISSFIIMIFLIDKFSLILSIPSVEELTALNQELQVEIRKREKKELALLEKQHEFNVIIQNAPIGKAILDLEGNWVDVNIRLSKMFGFTRDDMLANNFQSMTYEGDLAKDMEIMGALISGTVDTLEFEKRFYDKERKIWYGLVNVSIIRSQTKKGFFIAQIIDITDRKNREEADKRIKQQLKEEVELRTHELQEVNQDLKNFVYVIGHDFRAPLNNLHQLAEMLQEDMKEEGISEESAHVLSLISKNAANMSNMLSDMLNFSTLSKQSLKKEWFDMNNLVQEVYEECTLLSAEKEKVILRLAELPSAYGDLSAIRQVLQNLISNALKYSAKEERSKIEIGGATEESFVRYWVKDNGVGFDEKYKDKLFTLFQRLHSLNDFEGTGVGLSIVHRIIRKHGGKIWAESKEGQGATFYFTLPIPLQK